MSEIVSALPYGMRPEVARRRIEVFRKRFGNAHLYLAYHAAFPIALTPDLVYRLRATFQRDVYGELLNIPWIAVADLLLSSLCEEVGYELYEMNVAVRNELLSQLRTHENFGTLRISELSNFLLKYVCQQLNSYDPDTRDFAHAQYWTALVATNPEEAAHSIALTLSKLDPLDRAGFARMKSLIETLGEPSDEFATLLAHTFRMEQYARGNQEQPKAELKDCLINYHDTDNDWANWIRWQIEEAGYSVALQPWNFQPGANFAVEMEKATRISNRIIPLYSQNYLDALSNMPGWNTAFLQTPNQGRGLLLPIRVNDCDPDTLLGPTDYLDLVGLNAQEAQEQIRQFAHRNLGATRPLPDADLDVVHSTPEQPALPPALSPETQPAPSQQKPVQGIEIFIAYAREDRALREELELHLAHLRRQGLISGWHNREVNDLDWKRGIDTHLDTAQVILLLLSQDFIASDYGSNLEMYLALERHEDGECRVIPIILRPVDWQRTPFGKLQALPTDARPITLWPNRDEAFSDVARGIGEVIKELRKTVFIAYSRADGAFVTRLKNDLGSAGITTTGIEGIQIGTPDWEEATQTEIRSADAVLFIASPDARQSPYVQDELLVATSYRRPVYPIWAAGTGWPDSVPLGFGSTQYIDARGERYESALKTLIRTIRDSRSTAKSTVEAEPPVQTETASTPAPSKRTPLEDTSTGSKSRQLIPGTGLSGGRYRIERIVAAGGMGAVYLAIDQRFNRPCAVKEMLDDFQNENERAQAIEWFRREATLLLDLNHPSIPRVRDFFAENDRHYLVMDFIEGRTLAEILELEGNIAGANGVRGVSEERARSWAQQLCNVLSYLHQQSPPIIFRDLKPSNIMATDRDEIKLIDFGIARTFRSQRQSTIIMTIGYAPPEQMQGMPEPRSDIYALGATLYRVLTHYDAANNKPNIFTFPSIRTLRPFLSPEFAEVVMKALEPTIEKRWKSAAEMERAIINLPPIPATKSVGPITSEATEDIANITVLKAFTLAEREASSRASGNLATTGPAGSNIILAQQHLNENRIEEAYAAIQQAYSLEPNNALVHKIYGQVFARRQPPAPDTAIQAYTRSLQLNSNDAETHKLLGDVWLLLRKQPSQALSYYLQSLRLNPNDVGAHLRLAQCYEEMLQFESALWEYQEAARLAPGQTETHIKVGQLAMGLNQLPLAARAFVAALTLNPGDYQTRFLLSQVYENEGKLQDAERECGYVVIGLPKNKEAHEMLERLRRQNKRKG